jgi:hypothetical protein
MRFKPGYLLCRPFTPRISPFHQKLNEIRKILAFVQDQSPVFQDIRFQKQLYHRENVIYERGFKIKSLKSAFFDHSIGGAEIGPNRKKGQEAWINRSNGDHDA